MVRPLQRDGGLWPRPPRPALSAHHRDLEAQPQYRLGHVATFGERARDVFYVTDLLGAQVTAPTRQAAIKSAPLHLPASEDQAAKPAA
ncbi:hypothetical protein ABH973_000864 [Bradyrhizobium ottawaense]